MGEWLWRFFDNTEFMPHGRCWAWEPWVVWSNVVSDVVITLSYLTIGITLWWFVRRRRDLAFNWMFLMFATFIVACGLTHAMEVLNTWNAYFRLAGGVKIITAIASLPTAVFLIRIMPTALDLPTPQGLAKINDTLREREAGMRLLVEGVKDYAIFMVDPQGCVASWNQGAERTKGYAAEEIIGRPFATFFTAEDRAAGLPEAALAGALAEGRHESEGWRVRKDGSKFFANVVLTPARRPDGSLLGFVKITRDITERRDMLSQLQAHRDELERTVAERTRELKESQEILRLIYESTQDPLMLLKAHPGGELEVVSCNHALAALIGENAESMDGISLERLLSPPAEPVLEAIRGALADGRERRLERRAALPGGERSFDVQIVPISDGPGGHSHILIASRDITDRNRVEEALRQSQKLESLGVLAGGIAHDFNNLLTTILGNSNLGAMALPLESPGRTYFSQIEEASLRAADLTRQLLAYAGKGNFVLAEVDLNRAVAEMTKLLSVSISKKAALRYDLAEMRPKVMADPSQIQQLIMNLVTNASEAIGEETSGLITIRTGLQFLDESYIETLAPSFPLSPGLYATLEVSDTGCGMSPETQGRIFDPFYTTKFTGRGLGLSAMMGILRSHKGSLKLYSEVSKGSTFKLFLPARESSLEPSANAGDGSPWRGTGLVMVVDDEPAARAVGRQMAESLGFKVLEAADGRDAVAVFRTRHSELVLVLMDLTMPHLDGREAFAQLQAIDSGVPVILCSGYSETDAAQAFVGRGLAGFLQKPYRHSEFTAVFRKALEGT
ncbi:MAG TPA: PAS domain S-box protein [Holophagaceae bacterium]|nr:PAS domain S-box protein [Holophagaceae bacterium]